MRQFHDDSKEITIVSILNDGNIPFSRIIPGNDNAFVLEHRILQEDSKIILFKTPQDDTLYKMFIYLEGHGIMKQIKYDNMYNTWSYFNSLCKTLDRFNLNTNKKWKKPQKPSKDW